jgi:hypothetical protein
MNRFGLVVFPVLFLLAACATVKDMTYRKKFDQASQAYGDAIRWSEFETAQQFVRTEGAGAATANLARLNEFKVTSYDVKHTTPLEELLQVRQEAEIKYYKKGSLIEKTLRDLQLWEYDEERNRWYLVSGFPAFK